MGIGTNYAFVHFIEGRTKTSVLTFPCHHRTS